MDVCILLGMPRMYIPNLLEHYSSTLHITDNIFEIQYNQAKTRYLSKKKNKKKNEWTAFSGTCTYYSSFGNSFLHNFFFKFLATLIKFHRRLHHNVWHYPFITDNISSPRTSYKTKSRTSSICLQQLTLTTNQKLQFI